MKYYVNNTASFYCEEALLPYISRLCFLVKENPFMLEHVRGVSSKSKDIFQKEGFQIYSTVETTILLYHQGADFFLKILCPLNLKKRIYKFLCNRAEQIYSLSEALIAQRVKVPRIKAFGRFRKKRMSFFAMESIEGKSLYELLLREKKQLPMQTYIKVIEEIAKFHNVGYWLGDAHLSHIFIKDAEVSGFIDIDSIKKNRPYMLRHFAKDIAGVNHPKLPITKKEKNNLLNYYLQIAGIKNEVRFRQLVKYYTERRWKA
jgi:hypothetical protein